MCIAFYFILRQLQVAKRTPFSDTRRFPSYQTHEEKSILQPRRKIRSQLGDPLSASRQTVRNPPHPIRQKAPEIVRVMFVGTQVLQGGGQRLLSAFLHFSLFLLCGKLVKYLAQGRRNARLRLALLHRTVHRADVAVHDADALVGAAGVFFRPLAHLDPLDK